MTKRESPLRVWRERLRREFRRLPAFRGCKNCGEGALFVPYHPETMGCWLWCYVCGAKDELARDGREEDGGGRKGGRVPRASELRELRRRLEAAGVDVDELLRREGLR
jgi:hypothetical protein